MQGYKHEGTFTDNWQIAAQAIEYNMYYFIKREALT